jgi:predicted lipase
VDNTTLLFLAQCSQIAYKLKRKKSIPRLGIKVEKILRDQDGQIRGFLATRGDEAIISIKGTASLTDAAIDVDVSKVEFNGTLVHAGFERCYEAIKHDVYQFVKRRERVLVTGHSMGAAIATLLATMIAIETHSDISLVTFGSPRVGNKAFTELFNSLVLDSTRVVHEFDIVARVPKIDFNHVNTELLLDDNGKLMGRLRKVCNFFYSFGEIVLADLSGEALGDHRMTSYVKVVRMYAK